MTTTKNYKNPLKKIKKNQGKNASQTRSREWAKEQVVGTTWDRGGTTKSLGGPSTKSMPSLGTRKLVQLQIKFP